jgi:hypothetical protein
MIHCLPIEFGNGDRHDPWTLYCATVEFRDGSMIIPCRCGWGNRIAEEFAPRLQGRPHEFCPMWSIRYDIEQGQLPGS